MYVYLLFTYLFIFIETHYINKFYIQKERKKPVVRSQVCVTNLAQHWITFHFWTLVGVVAGEVNGGFVGDAQSVAGSRKSLNLHPVLLMPRPHHPGGEADRFSEFSNRTGRSKSSAYRAEYASSVQNFQLWENIWRQCWDPHIKRDQLQRGFSTAFWDIYMERRLIYKHSVSTGTLASHMRINSSGSIPFLTPFFEGVLITRWTWVKILCHLCTAQCQNIGLSSLDSALGIRERNKWKTRITRNQIHSASNIHSNVSRSNYCFL